MGEGGASTGVTLRRGRTRKAWIAIGLAAVVPFAAAFWNVHTYQSPPHPALSTGQITGMALGLLVGLATGSLSAWVLGCVAGILVGTLDLEACFGLVGFLRFSPKSAAAVPVWGLLAGVLVAANRRATWREGVVLIVGGAVSDFAGRWLGKWVLHYQGWGQYPGGFYSPWAMGASYVLPCITLLLFESRATDSTAGSHAGGAKRWIALFTVGLALILGPALQSREWYSGLPRAEDWLRTFARIPIMSSHEVSPPLRLWDHSWCGVESIGDQVVCGVAEHAFRVHGFPLVKGITVHAGERVLSLDGYDASSRIGYYQMQRLTDGLTYWPPGTERPDPHPVDAQGKPVRVLELGLEDLYRASSRATPRWPRESMMVDVDPVRWCPIWMGFWFQRDHALVDEIERRVDEFLKDIKSRSSTQSGSLDKSLPH